MGQNPRVNAKMLRQALDDVQKIDKMTPPFSDGIRAEYFVMMNTFQDPKEMRLLLQYASRPANGGTGYGVSGIIDDMRLWGLDRLQESKVYSRNEPERSKRVLRLVFANILAHCDDLPSRRPAKAEPPLPLYQISAADPFAARALPPKEIQKWYDTTIYAKDLWPAMNAVENAYNRERGIQSATLMTLAEQLYRREHGGKAPKSTADLVGPYLKQVPDAAPEQRR